MCRAYPSKGEAARDPELAGEVLGLAGPLRSHQVRLTIGVAGARAPDDSEDRMHAVVVKVTLNDREAAQSMLEAQVVPRVSQSPGFVAGYWTWKDNTGVSMVIFESEDAANGMSEQVRSMANDSVTIEDVEVREVVAHA
jgi:hypothetical protein